MVIIRLAIFIIFTFSGYILGTKYNYEIYGILLGGFLGIIAVAIEPLLRKVALGTIIGGILGISLGLLFANLLIIPFNPILGEESTN
ncbi:MAG: hypothetical protein OEW69_02100, partial [Nitrospirota bacterium]|nr:hypothetical protein [Nitrospirota bacterium]